MILVIPVKEDFKEDLIKGSIYKALGREYDKDNQQWKYGFQLIGKPVNDDPYMYTFNKDGYSTHYK